MKALQIMMMAKKEEEEAPFVWKIDTEKRSGTNYEFIVDNPDGLEVDWGDTNTSSINDSEETNVNVSHTYGSDGEYEISVTGKATRINAGTQNRIPALIDVLSLPSKSIGITSARDMFAHATNFPSNPTANFTNWDTSDITSMYQMFRGCINFNENVSNWNVSNVTNMYRIFNDTSFNQPIGEWNTSKVSNMSGMFGGAPAFLNRPHPFNQDISDWDTSNVTNMSEMFRDNLSFNQDIGKWDLGKVTNMHRMFAGNNSYDFNPPFNQNIGDWDTSKVVFNPDAFGDGTFTGMTSLFVANNDFNQDLTKWCVPGVDEEPNNLGGDSNWTEKPIWGECSYPHIKFKDLNGVKKATIKIYSDSGRTTEIGSLTTNNGGKAVWGYRTSAEGTLYYTVSKTGHTDVNGDFTIGTCNPSTECEDQFIEEEYTLN